VDAVRRRTPALVLGFAFWFGLLYPLIPVTTTGWLMEMVAGLAVGLWGTASIFAIRWVQRQTRFRLLFRALAVVIALSLGVGIFWIAVNAQGWAASNFSYFGR